MLLLDLYVAWLENPSLSVGVAMSQNSWDAWSRYNKLGISKKIVELIHRLVSAGLIDQAKGSYSGPYAPGNRITRIRAAKPLQKMFQELRTASRASVRQIAGQECIVLKTGDSLESKYQEYEDTNETCRMRDQLEAYNQLINRSFVAIPVLEEPWITRKNKFGDTIKVPVDRYHQFTRRIFSRGSWEMNGRFYGPWWQQISGKDRAEIFINDRPTVEIDFKGLHLAIIAAQQGLRLERDPYELPLGTVPDVPPRFQRELVKHLVLTALNARSKGAAFNSFRDGWPKGHMGKTLGNDLLSSILDLFVEQNPYAAESLGADVGIHLMNTDSRIAEIVIDHFTLVDVPILCIHDSFIIDYEKAKELKAIMTKASAEITGTPLKVEGKSVGLDEYIDQYKDEDIDDFLNYRDRERSAGYLAELRAWQEDRG